MAQGVIPLAIEIECLHGHVGQATARLAVCDPPCYHEAPFLSGHSDPLALGEGL